MYVATILKEKGTAIFTLGPSASLMEAAAMLTEKRIGSVVVLDEAGQLSGILSERDIVSAVSGKGPEVLHHPVADFMSTKVFTCHSDETVDHLMELMTAERIRHVPVVENNNLIGLVSIGDVVKHRIAETEMEAEAMRQYIAAN